MFGWLRKKKKLNQDEIERLETEWHEKKDVIMEKILGEEYGIVSHSIIPYAIGGALDLYYYPNCVEGTGIATKELALLCEESPCNAAYSQYELVMFTRHLVDLTLGDANAEKTAETPFMKEASNLKHILNLIARYSADATLNPGDTCEFPEEMEEVGGKCLIFDSYDPKYLGKNEYDFGMMLIMEIFRDAMEFALENGGSVLIEKLKKQGIYPYSDLNRSSVLDFQ